MVEGGGGVKRSEWDGQVERWGVGNVRKGLSNGARGRRPSWDWLGCINSCKLLLTYVRSEARVPG